MFTSTTARPLPGVLPKIYPNPITQKKNQSDVLYRRLSSRDNKNRNLSSDEHNLTIIDTTIRCREFLGAGTQSVPGTAVSSIIVPYGAVRYYVLNELYSTIPHWSLLYSTVRHCTILQCILLIVYIIVLKRVNHTLCRIAIQLPPLLALNTYLSELAVSRKSCQISIRIIYNNTESDTRSGKSVK